MGSLATGSQRMTPWSGSTSVIAPEACGRHATSFSEVTKFIDQSFWREESRLAFDWLLQFKRWGDSYQRLIVNSLIGGPLESILDKSLDLEGDDENEFEGFHTRVLSLMTDMAMKRAVLSYLLVAIPRWLSCIDPKRLQRMSALIGLLYQVLLQWEITSEYVLKKNMLDFFFRFGGKVLDHALKDERLVRITLATGLPLVGTLLLQNPALARTIVFDRPEARDVLF
jgi:hypothetical protein